MDGQGWNLDNGSIIAKITNKGINQQIAASTDAAKIAQLENNKFWVNAARLLLLATFASIAGLVYLAYQKRVKEGRI
jgi:hypothetical protein